MSSIKELILQLDQYEPRWQEYIKNNDDSKVSNISGFREKIAALLLGVRQLIKSEDVDSINEMKAMITVDGLADSIIGQADKLLTHYKSMKPLRLLEKRNLKLCKEFLNDALENYIVRYDWKWIDKFENYGFISSEEIKKVLESLEVLTDYYVGNAITEKRISEDFLEETNLSTEICDYYAKLIILFYQDIKFNLIFEGIERLNKRVKNLEKKISS